MSFLDDCLDDEPLTTIETAERFAVVDRNGEPVLVIHLTTEPEQNETAALDAAEGEH